MPSKITSPETYRIKNEIIEVLKSEAKIQKRSKASLVNESLSKTFRKQLIDRTKAKDK